MAALASEPATRDRFADTVTRQRTAVRALTEDDIEAGELRAVPANAMASILLALTEGLVLHGSLDRRAFRWTNVYRALDFILDGIKPQGAGGAGPRHGRAGGPAGSGRPPPARPRGSDSGRR